MSRVVKESTVIYLTVTKLFMRGSDDISLSLCLSWKRSVVNSNLGVHCYGSMPENSFRTAIATSVKSLWGFTSLVAMICSCINDVVVLVACSSTFYSFLFRYILLNIKLDLRWKRKLNFFW